MLSLVIRNAEIVDGSGGAARRGDIGVAGDRIAAVGSFDGKGTIEIDAGGKTLAPGFIDIHTHYDPQLCWDRHATPTPEHGVSSIVMGNCSISLAPVRAPDRTRVMHLFGSVEDMEGRLLEATVPFSWESVEDYLRYLGEGLGPNVGAIVGHSVLRLYVMGKAAQERVATDAEIADMAAILEAAVKAGAFGLSFTFNHFDEHGGQLPCHYADRREKRALLEALARAGRGIVEIAPNFFRRDLGIPCVDEWGELALETGVTCSLSPILALPTMPGAWKEILARFHYWRGRGAPLFAQTQVRPLDMTIQLAQGSTVLSKSPAWRKSFEEPLERRISLYADAASRATLIAEGQRLKAALEPLKVKRAHASFAQNYADCRVADIAAQEKKDFFEVLLDISLADELATEFSLEGYLHSDEDAVAQLLTDDAVQIGSGDAGAHITQFSGAGDTCYLFEKFVRERGDLSVPQAVRRLTSEIADSWKISGRGRIAVGNFADLVLFDPQTIARGREEWVDDVPGSQGRYIRRAHGIDRVIVNGRTLVEDGRYSRCHPGRIL
jgi:N-acyl-D-aspartate/D-glutamate deacylase